MKKIKVEFVLLPIFFKKEGILNDIFLRVYYPEIKTQASCVLSRLATDSDMKDFPRQWAEFKNSLIEDFK